MRFGDDGAVAVDTMPLTATSTAAPTMDTASTSVSVEVPMDRNVEMHLAKMGPYPPLHPAPRLRSSQLFSYPLCHRSCGVPLRGGGG